MPEDKNYIVNKRQIAFVALAMGIASIFLNIMPLVLGGLQDKFLLDSRQAGNIPAYTMTGYTITVVVLSQLYNKINWRWLVAAGSALAAASLAYSALLNDAEWLNPVAVATGMGIAIVYGAGMEIISFTREPERGYSMVVFVSSLLSSILLYASSNWILAIWGISGVLMMMAILCAGLVFLCPFIPARAPNRERAIANGESSLSVWLCLLGVVCFFAAYSGLFAFLERIGTAAGLSIEFIGKTLAINSFIAAAGCLVAAIIGARYGYVRSFIVGAAGMALSLLGFSPGLGQTQYFVGTFTFMFSFNFSLAYLWGWIAVCDPSEKVSAYLPVAIGVGSIIGTGLSGYLVRPYGFGGVILFALTMVILTVGIYAYSGLKNRPPAVLS